MFQPIQVRKLAAVEMAVLGTQVTVFAYALGMILPLLFGLFALVLNSMAPQPADWQVALGTWLVAIAVNYVPLFAYALSIARAGTVAREGEPELAHARRYSIQQIIVLIPFLVPVLTLAQERGRRRALS
jgi:hypothetical protein